MRWEAQTLRTGGGAQRPGAGTPAGSPATLPLPGLQRVVSPPEFAGVTFHEVLARSALNKVPASSAMPFRWTVNPYRGCTHACVYCYARGTHRYLDLGPGEDFDRQIVVKTNAPEVLRAELSRPGWTREPVALGTNTDPYQRAEGRYRLMPGIIAALADTGTPFSILTKGTLLGRDAPALQAAAAQTSVQVGLSLALLDPSLAAAVEPGTPSPAARLRLISRLAEAGVEVSVMAMPLLPWLTDSDRQLDRLMAALADAGAHSVLAGTLHLRPGAREWFLGWIDREHPHLAADYRRMYARSAYAPQAYRRVVSQAAREAAARHGLRHGGAHTITREDGPGPRGGASAPLSAPASTTGAGQADTAADAVRPVIAQPTLF